MRTRRVTASIFAGGLAVIAAGTCGLLLTRHGTPARPSLPAAVAALPTPTAPIVASPQPAAPRPAARPVSLSIPLIGVSTRLITLGLTSHGSVQVPTAMSLAGWYSGSPRPGATGSAIILGHIDSYRGPGVFFRLAELHPGSQIYVRRSDGTIAVFRVNKVRTYLKNHFPTQAVYGATPDAELRLITCGGAFDSATAHYLSNIVVYATQAR